jgi:hypothetical protein
MVSRSCVRFPGDLLNVPLVEGPDGRYLGARSPARQLSRSEEHLRADLERVQHPEALGNQEGDSCLDDSFANHIVPKSPRKLSSYAAEQQDISTRFPLGRLTRDEMTTEQLEQEVEMLQQFNFEVTSHMVESLRVN